MQNSAFRHELYADHTKSRSKGVDLFQSFIPEPSLAGTLCHEPFYRFFLAKATTSCQMRFVQCDFQGQGLIDLAQSSSPGMTTVVF